MASHHHPCYHHPPAVAATSACHCCYPTYSPCHHQHPPPQPYYHQNPPHPPNLSQYYFSEERPNYPSVASLQRRIATLESALRRHSSHSLRDSAARTIQIHFRAFLCRRSRTLRHLKDLAAIKSTACLLKSSLSKRSANYDVLYHKTVNLLLRLDAIQGSDPMIRNGKSLLSIELNNILDSIDGFCVRGRMGISSRVNVKSRVSNSDMDLGNPKRGSSKGKNADKIRSLVERIDKLAEEIDEEEDVKPNEFTNGILGSSLQDGVVQPQPKVKKSVSFVENGKVYRVLRRPHKPLMVEYCGDERELDENDDDDHEEEEVESSKNGSLLGFDVEKSSRGYVDGGEGDGLDEDDDFVFRAPLPVKMEARDDSMDKRVRNS